MQSLNLVVPRFGFLQSLQFLTSRRILNSQTRFTFSSVSIVVQTLPTLPPPPPITESTILRSIKSSQRHFIKHLSPHLTPSILPSVLSSFDLTTRCLAFCTLYRLSYPQPEVHRLLHPLILTGAATPESILNELARARERLSVNSTAVFEALFRAYCELEKLDEALKCFQLMKEMGFLPKIETCNRMLMLFLKLNRNQAMEFMKQMEPVGLKPAIYNYNTRLEHRGEKFKVVCVMFQEMIDSGLTAGVNSNNFYNFVMYKEGRLEEASDSLEEMLESESKSGLVPHHAVIYDALIHEYCYEGTDEGRIEDIDNAIAYKDEMISRGIEPTIVTYTLLAEALFEIGYASKAQNMVNEMQEKGIKPDVYTYNTLMSGYGKRKHMDMHISLYDEMLEKRIQPNLLTFNTRILAYCRSLEMEEAHELFDEMNTRGIKPDYLSYNLLIGGYCHYDNPYMKEAFRVRDEMLKMGFDPTYNTYDTLIFGLCVNKELEHAKELLKEMVSNGICTPDDRSYMILTKLVHEK